MIRFMFQWAVFCVLVCGVTAADEDVVEKKLAAAKSEYEKAAEKATAGLVADMKKKADAAQKAGDLKTLDKVETEVKAFEEKGELPKSVPTKVYEGHLRKAKAKLEDAYAIAVKEYTQGGKRALAKATQKELDEFKSDTVAVAANDPFQKGTIWKGSRLFSKGLIAGKTVEFGLEVTERKGAAFKGVTASGAKGNVHAVEGTVKEGKIEWKVVKTLMGNVPGQDHTGSIKGDKITLEFKGDGGGGILVEGTGELKLEEKKK